MNEDVYENIVDFEHKCRTCLTSGHILKKHYPSVFY